MATANPLTDTYPIPPSPVSKKTFCIAGITVTAFGLDELDTRVRDVACLWLLHPRLESQECMAPVAASTIHAWREEKQKLKKEKALGLICISFDQRNHGSREVNALSNETWRSGNKTHAQDMFASYHGTATDTSHLMNYIESYFFPASEHSVVNHIVLGVSLGGHAAWQCIISDPKITTAVVVIGCPDYARLMSDRARLSKLATWTGSTPPGSSFLGSTDFPKGLVEAVGKYDPAGLFLNDKVSCDDDVDEQNPNTAEQRLLLPLMKRSLQGKRILSLSGGADKLVPYRCGAPFLRWLKNATTCNGWFSEGGVVLSDIVVEGVGHNMSPEMVQEAHRFVVSALEQTPTENAGRASKM